MSSKRNLDDDGTNPSSSPAPSTKRVKRDGGSSRRNHQNAYMDPTWGQKYFFLGQDATSTVPQDDDLDFEDDADALAYLRGVRKQATSIPHLLVAPKIGPQLPPSFRRGQPVRGGDDDESSGEEGEVHERSVYESGEGDFRGYYRDGAYTAAPDDVEADENPEEEADPAAAAAQAYHAAIRARFLALRSLLRAEPPPSAVSALPVSNSPHVGSFGPRSYAFVQWTKRLEATDPLPAQVACMDKNAVLRVLRVVMGGKFLRVGRRVEERTSRWLWALLGRLPPAGELAHTEVGWVRDLGRRAVLLGRSLAEMAALREEMAGGEVDLGMDESEEGEEVVVEDSVDDEDEDEYGEDEGGDSEETPLSRPADLDREEAGPKGHGDTDNGPEKKPKDGEDEEGQEEGQVDEDEGDDVPMDIEAGDDDAQVGPSEDLEAARQRLLAQVGQVDALTPPEGSTVGEEEADGEATMRARMNMRATINMILTVAGEFYGQRDLLEFRDPFTGM